MSNQSHRGGQTLTTPCDHEDDYKPGENIGNNLDLRREILHELKNPRFTFDGTKPEQFEKWRSNICRSLRTIGCNANLVLELLERNTSGGALDIVTHVQDSGVSASQSLVEVWRRLRQRFGDTTLVAESLSQAVVARDRFPDYSRQHRDYEKNVLEMERFLWLCKRLQAGMEIHTDLSHFNSKVGLQQIATKMPTEFERDWEKLVHRLRQRPLEGEEPRLPKLVDLISLMDEFISRKANPFFLSSTTRTLSRKCLVTRPEETSETSGQSVLDAGQSSADQDAFKVHQPSASPSNNSIPRKFQ